MKVAFLFNKLLFDLLVILVLVNYSFQYQNVYSVNTEEKFNLNETNNQTLPTEESFTSEPEESKTEIEEEKQPEPEPEQEPVSPSISLLIPYAPKEDYLQLSIHLGNPGKDYSIIIDTNSAFTWLPSSNCLSCITKSKYDKKYSKSKTELMEIREVTTESWNIEGELITDKISISQLNLDNFIFISAEKIDQLNNNNYFEAGVLGLGRPIEKEIQESIISSMVNNGIIKDNKFTLRVFNSTHAEITFGNPNELINNNKAPFCNLVNQKDLPEKYKQSWVCNSKYLLIDNKDIIKIDSNVNFDASSNYIYAPFDVIDVINTNIIKKYFGSSCRMINDNWEVSFICKSNQPVEPKDEFNLEFVFGIYGLKLNITNLFNQINKADKPEYEFLIRFRKNEDKVWNLGYPFLSNFIVLFDNDNKKIFFNGEFIDYSNSPSQFDIAYNKKLVIGMIIACFSVIAITVAFIFICIYTTHKDKRDLLKHEEKPSNNNNNEFY